VIYCDALYISLKRGNSYSKEALYLIYGVKDDNTRELLLLEVNPTESSNMWGEFLSKLIQRGVEQVDLIVADGLPYFADVAKKYFREADVQRCVVHLQRDLMRKVRPRDKAAFCYDLKEVFDNFLPNVTFEDVMKKISKFVGSWTDKYGKILQKLLDEEYISDYLTYIQYPAAVRRMIYTTNSVENLNRQVRKVTKTKVTFDKEDNLLDLVFMVIKDFEYNNWQRYPVHNFKAWPKRFTH
jgi:transposase-like protein